MKNKLYFFKIPGPTWNLIEYFCLNTSAYLYDRSTPIAGTWRLVAAMSVESIMLIKMIIKLLNDSCLMVQDENSVLLTVWLRDWLPDSAETHLKWSPVYIKGYLARIRPDADCFWRIRGNDTCSRQPKWPHFTPYFNRVTILNNDSVTSARFVSFHLLSEVECKGRGWRQQNKFKDKFE